MHFIRHIAPNVASGAAVTSPVLVMGMPVTIFMPYLMQFVTLVGALAYAFYRDGSVGDQFIWALMGAVGLNIVAGGLATFSAHHAAGLAAANGMVSEPAPADEPAPMTAGPSPYSYPPGA